MVDFKLDTSGFVEGPPQGVRTKRFYWSDLSPFAQGYVEALFDDFYRQEQAKARDHFPRVSEAFARHGLSDLSPEALALILKDCAEVLERFGDYRPPGHGFGMHFWENRQAGLHEALPPLTVSLGNDGKIHLSPSHEHGAAK